MSEYFPFYDSYKKAISKLPDAERLAEYDAITNYGIYGVEPADKVIEFLSRRHMILPLYQCNIFAFARECVIGNTDTIGCEQLDIFSLCKW